MSPENTRPSKSDWLKELGFDSSEPVHQFMPDWTLDELKESLFASTSSNPKTIRIELSETVLKVLVTSVSQRYVACQEDNSGSHLTCYEHPDWLLECQTQSELGTDSTRIRLRLYITVAPGGSLDYAYIQQIAEHAHSDGEITVVVHD